MFIARIAVSAAYANLLSRGLVVAGLIIGLVGVTSALDLINHNFLFLIPLTRFSGFIWIVIAGFKLKK